MTLYHEAYSINKSKDYFYVIKSKYPKLYNELKQYKTLQMGYTNLMFELENLKTYIMDRYYENKKYLYFVMKQIGIKEGTIYGTITTCCLKTEQLSYHTLVKLRNIKKYYEDNKLS